MRGGKLYVADTNNHPIRTIDLSTGKLATLDIPGLEPPPPPKAPSKLTLPGTAEIDVPAARVKPVDGRVRLHVALALPEGYKMNPEAPLRYLVEPSTLKGPIERDVLSRLTDVAERKPNFDIELPVTGDAGTDRLKVSLAFYYCQEGAEGVCKAGSVVWMLPLNVANDASDTSAPLTYSVP